MNGSGGRLWLFEKQPFDQLYCFCRQPSPSTILARLSNEASQAIDAVLSKPAFHGP